MELKIRSLAALSVLIILGLDLVNRIYGDILYLYGRMPLPYSGLVQIPSSLTVSLWIAELFFLMIGFRLVRSFSMSDLRMLPRIRNRKHEDHRYQCEDCGKTFPAHIKSVNVKKSQLKLICPLCGAIQKSVEVQLDPEAEPFTFNLGGP